MADNVSITPGSGNTVAADEVTDGTLGTVKVQYTKLMDGTLDSTNKLIVTSGGAAKVDGSAVTQPISTSSLPLPTGAATSVNQTNGTQETQLTDGTTTIGPTQTISGVNYLPVVLSSSASDGNPVPSRTVVISGKDGSGNAQTLKTNGSGALQTTISGTAAISAASLPLPTGASTDASLTNGNQKSQIVDGSGNVIGPSQTISGTNYLPVVLASSGTNGSTVPVRTIQIGGSDGTNLRSLKVSTTGVIAVDGSSVTQPVSAVSLPLPTGAATSTNQSTEISSLASIVTNTSTQSKQVQATAFLPVQEVINTGRTAVVFSIDRIAGVTTEALATFTINKAGTVTSGTSYTVTSGKTLHIQSMSVSIADSTTTAVNGRVRLRSAGTVTATSPIFALLDISNFTGTALAGAGNDQQIAIPDGLEIASGQQVGISQILSSTSSTLTVGIIGFEY